MLFHGNHLTLTIKGDCRELFVEVDLVIERGQDVWGVEVKRSASIQPKDIHGLAKFADQVGKGFRGGMLIILVYKIISILIVYID